MSAEFGERWKTLRIQSPSHVTCRIFTTHGKEPFAFEGKHNLTESDLRGLNEEGATPEIEIQANTMSVYGFEHQDKIQLSIFGSVHVYDPGQDDSRFDLPFHHQILASRDTLKNLITRRGHVN